MNKVEKIKAEIERRYEYWKEKESNSHSIESESRMSECNHLLSMIISLSDTEKDFGIKESVIPFGASDSELMEATYFIPQGYHAVIDGNKVIIKKGEEPVSNDLEKACDEYYDETWDEHGGKAMVVDGCHDIWFPSQATDDFFKAGAQWQKKQDQSTIELAEDHAYLAGQEKMIDKACDWLLKNDSYAKPTEVLVRDLKKAMEE